MVLDFLEIVLHIFSIASDSESRGLNYSQPRYMKPFVGRVAQVCRRWAAIMHWKANSHFWTTDLHLQLSALVGPHDTISLHNHCVCMVMTFRRALSAAEDGDIALHWNHHLDEQMSTDGCTIWSRIFMHCVSMLSQHSSQLVGVHLRHLSEYKYSFAKAWLSGLESSSRLQRLSVPLCGGIPTNILHLDPAPSFYNIGYHDPLVSLSSAFLSLRNIYFGST